MTIEKAIKYFEETLLLLYGVSSPDKERIEACALAVSALRAQQPAEKNKPLTLDELIKMDGELAYFQFGDGECGYAVISTDRFRNIGLDGPDVIINHSAPDKDFLNMEMEDDPYGHFGLHLLGWRAYRQKPEEAIP